MRVANGRARLIMMDRSPFSARERYSEKQLLSPEILMVSISHTPDKSIKVQHNLNVDGL
jgi:hypothetical protein